MPQSTDFAAIVRLLREHHGLTQEQFAHRIGVSFSAVNVWENGKRAPLPFLRKRILERDRPTALGEDEHRGANDAPRARNALLFPGPSAGVFIHRRRCDRLYG